MEPSDLDRALMRVMTAEGRADPYADYAAIREATPLHRSAIGSLVVSRYADCQQLLRDQRFGHREEPPEAAFATVEEFQRFRERFPRVADRAPVILEINPPEHTRLRSLVSKAFTPRTVDALRPRIGELADALLDELNGEVDIVPSLALELPVRVISELLGVPAADHAHLIPEIRKLIQAFDTAAPTVERFTQLYDARNAVDDYFAALVERKRRAPAADLLTELLQVEEGGDQLSEAELLSTIMLLFVAGYESTTNLIANGLRALLLHPEQLQRLRDDRSLVKRAVEEMLRWDSPVQLVGRFALADAEVAGEPVRKHEQVVVLLGAANRDPRAFRDPDTFDVGRSEAPPLSFSAGIHHCLGAALARAEGHVLFERLLDRYRTIEPAWPAGETIPYRDNLVLRGVSKLQVRLGV